MFVEGYQFQSVKNISGENIKKLSGKRYFFGHQSVGYNIIEGLNTVIKDINPSIFIFNESLDGLKDSGPVFTHSRVGKNGNPISKIDDFAKNIRRIGGKVDIAMLKLCYVDITQETDIEKVFSYYKKMLSELKQQYPQIIFLHFTVPLTSREKGIKTFIKKLIGKKYHGYEDNIAKESYNNMLRAEYKGNEPLFDLAFIESTNQKGMQERYMQNGIEYSALVDEYTDDGGHLNILGKKIVAEQFLVFLANLLK